MATRFGEFRFREGRLVGLELGLIVYPPAVGMELGFKLVFYDKTGAKIGELGSDSQVRQVSEVDFELAEFGCGSFSFILDDLPAFSLAEGTRVDIHPYFDIVPWFSGFIQKIPAAGSRRPLTYEGCGFYDQLSWILVTKDYSSGQDISLVVKDIISTIVAPNTQILYNAAKVETTGYTLAGSISFDHVSAQEAIQTLAEAAQDFEFGVDDQREFYFRAVTADVLQSWWQGKHFSDCEFIPDSTQIKNKLYVKVGEIQAGGTNIIGSVSDAPSIAAHGLHEDVVDAPEILGTTDALRWAQYLLDQTKDPIMQGSILSLLFDASKVKIECRGQIRVTTDDGSEYIEAVKSIGYRLSSSGITADIELGQIQVPLEKKIVELYRLINEQERLGDQRTKQLY